MNKYFEVTSQPTKQETFTYKVKVSRDTYDGYERYHCGAKSQELTITIGRTIDIRNDFSAWLTGEIYKCKTDEFKTTYKGNALWNGLGYKSKKEWGKIIESYQTLGQLERDFLL